MEKISSTLMQIGIPKSEALIVELMSDHKPRTSREIEHDLYLAQPVVSTSTRTLKDFLDVKESDESIPGRPKKTYLITKARFNAYLQNISNQKEIELNKMIAALVALREIEP
jgi:predicted transcriptional regulator